MPKVLPSAPEAEASLLGTMMIYPQASRIAIEEGIHEDDFFLESNRNVFLCAKELYQEGSPIDLTTLTTRLTDKNLLERSGGLDYLMKLSEAAVTSVNTKTYVGMIKDKAIMRRLIEAAETIADEGFSGQPDVDSYLDSAEKAILDISHARRTGEFKTSPEVMSAVVENIRKMQGTTSGITGYKTSLDVLDDTLHGLQRGDLIILAARPSMGKTAVALNLALNVAMNYQNQAVAIFSLEMGAEQLGMRLLSARSQIPGDKLRTGELNDDEMNRMTAKAEELRSLKIFIDDNPLSKVGEMTSKCRRLSAEHGLALVVIDYIQLITSDRRTAGENRQQEVSEISRSLKNMARELNVPVIALSQLSRSVEQRDDKRPRLSDLRESGAIEQDADVVMMLYRESYYNDQMRQETADKSESLEINIAKHRNGAVRRVNVAFTAQTNALNNIDYVNRGS